MWSDEQTCSEKTNRIALHTCARPPAYLRGTGQAFHYEPETIASAAHEGDVTGLHFLSEDALLSTSSHGALHAWKITEAGPSSTTRQVLPILAFDDMPLSDRLTKRWYVGV